MTFAKPKSRKRAQSAIEYLVTHAWAFLIIAIVLGILYQLGVFSASTYIPKVSPGSCYVSRAVGAYATQFSLTGACSGIPEYTTNFTSSTGGYMGVNSPSNSLLNFASQGGGFTIAFWIDIYPIQTSGTPSIFAETNTLTTLAPLQIYIQNPSAGNPGTYTSYNVPNLKYIKISGSVQDDIGSGALGSSGPISIGRYTFLALTFAKASGTATWYVNGKQYIQFTGLAPVSTTVSPANIFIGGSPTGNPGYLNASLANFQVYNTSLSGTDVMELYTSGIGGPPIALQSLVAWWPFNGDTNDYSGLANSGQENSLVYSSAWSNEYIEP